MLAQRAAWLTPEKYSCSRSFWPVHYFLLLFLALKSVTSKNAAVNFAGEAEGHRATGLRECGASEEDTDPERRPEGYAAVPPGGLPGE